MKHKDEKSWIQYSEECGEIVIDMLFVDPSERGKNKGYELLNVAQEYAREAGMNMSLCAFVQSGDMPLEKLIEYYRDYGFESDGNCDELMTYTI